MEKTIPLTQPNKIVDKSTRLFANSRNFPTFVVNQAGNLITSSGQAVNLLNHLLGFFIAQFHYRRLPLRKYRFALRGTIGLVQRKVRPLSFWDKVATVNSNNNF